MTTTMTRDDLRQILLNLHACPRAIKWFDATSGQPSTLWHTCPDGDWLLRLAAEAKIDRKTIVLAAADCAETVAEYWPTDTRTACVWALDSARRWARGEAELDEVRAATSAVTGATTASDATYAAASAGCAAYAASTAPAVAAANYAASAVTGATHAVAATGHISFDVSASAAAAAAAGYTGNAAYTAAYAAVDAAPDVASIVHCASTAVAAAYAAQRESLKVSADLVRKRITWPMVELALVAKLAELREVPRGQATE